MQRLYRHTNHFMGTYAIFTETRNRFHRFTCFCFSTLHYQLYLQRCRPSGAWKWDDFFATKISPLRGLNQKSIMILFLTFLRFNVFHYQLSIINCQLYLLRCRPYRAWKPFHTFSTTYSSIFLLSELIFTPIRYISLLSLRYFS